jgi:hypothetical protein
MNKFTKHFGSIQMSTHLLSANLAPGTRIMFLLGEQNDVNNFYYFFIFFNYFRGRGGGRQPLVQAPRGR